MTKPTPQVLLVRVNARVEVFNSSRAVDFVRERYPAAALVAVSAPNSEAIDAIQADSRIRDVAYTPASVGIRGFLAWARSLGRSRPAIATVIFADFTEGLSYERHLLAGLFFPGRKYLLGPDLGLIPLFSLRGLRRVGLALRTLARRRFGIPALLRKYPVFGSASSASAAIPSTAARILLIRLDALGDVVSVLPVILAVKGAYPRARVDVLIRKHIAPILADVDEIDNIVTHDRILIDPADRGTHDTVRRLRRARYDAAVELCGNSTTGRQFARLSGAPVRIGVVPERQDIAATEQGLLTGVLALPDVCGADERNAVLAEALGVGAYVQPFRFDVSDSRRARLDTVLTGLGIAGPYAVIHARASSGVKEWRAERFAEVADYLVEAEGLTVVLTGTKEDAEENARIREAANHAGRIVNLADRIALADLPALFDSARIAVSVDTGPMHVAGATRAPLVGLLIPQHRCCFPAYREQDVIVPSTPAGASLPDAPLDLLNAANVIAAVRSRLA